VKEKDKQKFMLKKSTLSNPIRVYSNTSKRYLFRSYSAEAAEDASGGDIKYRDPEVITNLVLQKKVEKLQL
jgi:hypothetical protein